MIAPENPPNVNAPVEAENDTYFLRKEHIPSNPLGQITVESLTQNKTIRNILLCYIICNLFCEYIHLVVLCHFQGRGFHLNAATPMVDV